MVKLTAQLTHEDDSATDKCVKKISHKKNFFFQKTFLINILDALNTTKVQQLKKHHI